MQQEVTTARRREVARVRSRLGTWASRRRDVQAVAMVGSWARGSANMASDVDFVVLTDDPAGLVGEEWWRSVGPAEPIGTAAWGALTEQRLRLPSGLELDVGIADPSWAATQPIDPGTRKVIGDGVEVVYDPRRRLEELIAAARG